MIQTFFSSYIYSLQLEECDRNNNLSPEMKRFFRDIIHTMDDITSQLEANKTESRTIQNYLDYKNLKYDFTKFKNFILINPNSTENEIRAYFRKYKIEKILNEQL